MGECDDYLNRKYRRYWRWLLILLFCLGINMWLVLQLWMIKNWAFYVFLLVMYFNCTQIERVIRKIKNMRDGMF